MKTIFTDLISGHDFDRQLDHYFDNLSSSDVDYLYAYSKPGDNPCLIIDFDNCIQVSRITLWESGECDIEAIALTGSTKIIGETSELKTIGEFEDKLLSLIEYMKRTQTIH